MSLVDCKLLKVNADPREYFAAVAQFKRGDPLLQLSSSSIREIVKCPTRWVEGYEPPMTDAKEYGALIDCLALTPDHFDARFAVKPTHYTNKKGERCDWRNDRRIGEVADWLDANKGKEHTDEEALNEGRKAVARLFKEEDIKRFFDASAKQVWLTGWWADEQTGLRIPVQSLIDLVPDKDSEWGDDLADFKTCRNAAVRKFFQDGYNFGYHIQGAFNTDVYNAATGEKRDTWCWILQENIPPYIPGRRIAGQDGDLPGILTLGRVEYQAALALYCQCLKTGKWPSYDDHPHAVQGWSVWNSQDWQVEAANAKASRTLGDEPEWASDEEKEAVP